MRSLLTVFGIAAIATYSVLGALLMNDWAVVAASETPLDTTIAEMKAANQAYSAVPGLIFATLGGLIALTWGGLTLHPRVAISNSVTISFWAGIVALGAPAYSSFRSET